MSAPLRIVSLLPSATEFTYVLGLGASLVGRSHECDAPTAALALPVCTRSLVAGTTSAEIDADVRRRLTAGEPLYTLDVERVRALEPTHVVTQAQCDVCAISEEDVRAMLEDAGLSDAPQILTLSPRTLGDVFADLQMLGRSFGVAETGRAVATELADRVSQVGEKTGGDAHRPTVLCLEWLDPPIASGSWIPELVRVAGGDPLFGKTGEPSRDVSWDAIAAADPDVIIAMPCGFDLPRTLDACAPLFEDERWRALRAVRTGQVTAVDGNAWFNRSGPRLVESLELLAEILSPDRFDFGLAGDASQQLAPLSD